MTGEFLAADAAIVEIPRGSRNKYEFDPATEGSISARPCTVLGRTLSG